MNTNSIRNNVRLGRQNISLKRNNSIPQLKKGSGMMNLESVNRVGGLPNLESIVGKPNYTVPVMKSNNFKVGKGMMNKKQNDNKDKILRKKMNNLRFEL